MTGWLVDTNILSELRRPRPEQKVLRFIAAQSVEGLFVSVVTFAEIRYGIENVSDPAQRSVLHHWLTNSVRPMFDGRVLPVGEDVMLAWRLLVQEGRKAGHTFSQPDLIIAATALHHGLTIVTRNTGDFARTGVPLFDPWIEPMAHVSPSRKPGGG